MIANFGPTLAIGAVLAMCGCSARPPSSVTTVSITRPNLLSVDEQSDQKGLIPITEVYSRGIAGFTGERMGKIITVHGTVIEGASLDQGRGLPKLIATSTFLDIDRVDGREIKPPVRVFLASSPKRSGQVTVRGYETGDYTGQVHDPEARKAAAGRKFVAIPQTDFRFRTEFVVLDQTTDAERALKAEGHDKPATDAIPIAEIYDRKVAGLTGEEMGKVIKVHGKVVSGDSLYPAVPRSIVDGVFVEVDQVDGRDLKPPVRVRLAGGLERDNDVRAMQWDQKAVSFRGYETGAYEGLVNDVDVWKAAGGGEAAFGFKMKFVALERLPD